MSTEDAPAADPRGSEAEPDAGVMTVPTMPLVEGIGGTRPIVAGYDLVRVIGRGGMGVVWEALEHRFDRVVALKVHAVNRVDEGDELWSEAFVAARIGDPGIVRVLDVGRTLEGQPYYAMELVTGTDLGAVIADGRVPARKAVAIAADIARAAAAAHEHGVIHRDLKPRNVIIDDTGRGRVVDFGVAVDVHRGDRFAGQLAGSPAYMAPEQVLGGRVTPQTDIWAIGVILFEMLTGARPFVGATTEALLSAVALVDAPKPSDADPSIHADLDAVVARCLAKTPEDRYPSARALFETLTAIAEGRPVDLGTTSLKKTTYAPKASTLPPPDRPRREEAKKHIVWSWRLASSPAALWPFVANTERFNRAVGLSPVHFTDEPQPEGGSHRTGELKVLGMALRWREYPFEWIKDREHSVFRWYRSGPLAALWNHVTLTPLEGGGTELRHEIWLSPRGVFGQVAAFVELDRKLGPAVDRFYRHLDEVLVGGAHLDPFEPPHAPTAEQRAAVSAACSRLHEAGFGATIVEKLAMHLLTAPDGVLRTIRPFELADRWGAERAEVLDVLMHAAHEGVLEAAWDVVCPKCMLAHESLAELAQVTRVGTCRACASQFERDLRDSVELVFTPSPHVRRVEHTTYCAGAPALRPHVVAQQVLDPGEQRRITVHLPRGHYRVAGSIASIPYEIVSSAVGFEDKVEISARGDKVEGRPGIVRAGTITFLLENASEHEETLRIEVPGSRTDGVPAATAMTHPSFGELFAEQRLAHGEHIRVSQLAFVFAQATDRQALFEKLGDATACAAISRLDTAMHEAAHEHEGSVVPSSLDLLVAAFPTALHALRAALALRKRVDAIDLPSPVAIAAHDGRCLALTRDGKPEFFGETLHRGQALLQDAPPHGIALSASFAAERDVAVAVHEHGLRVVVTKAASGPYAGRRVTLLTPPA
ncbi:MAG: serine/threonine protein kinase [Deltaproteobacteria bacterium]|nr:serine/threonine protein kinase [Deltaproteobacteria bacterium]